MNMTLKPTARVATKRIAVLASMGCAGLGVAVVATAATTWTRIANEYQTFIVSGTKTVRYGAGTRWVQRSVTSSGRCTNAFFGSDPVPGVDKTCEVASTPPTTNPPPPPPTGVQYAKLSAASLGAGASLNGAVPFPANNAWNTDISNAPVDPNSANLIASIGLNTGLHADFGAGLYNGAPIGIPYVVVNNSQPGATINFTAYGDQSDPGPYPIPATAPVEGGLSSTGDRHVLVINKDTNRLYELYAAYAQSGNRWNADSGAVFHLDSNNVRPTAQPGWTSADAAGLPIFPGLVRYDEAAAGAIRHALRFTVRSTRRAYVPPATHWASSNTSVNLPPMGMRVRLKASYVIPATFKPEVKAILQAMKTYGMFVADNGSNWFVSGAPDDRWDNSALSSQLGSVKGSNFEVIRMDGLKQ